MKKVPLLTGKEFSNYLGLPGAGKTLSAIEEKVLPAYLAGVPIWSNTFINLKGVNYFSDIEEVLDKRNILLFIDELGFVLDPYDWANIPKSVRVFFQFHRKKKIEIVSTTQDISFLAKPARVLVSNYIFCENSDWGQIVAKIFSFFGYGEVRLAQRALTFNDLQKLQKGVGASPLIDSEEEEEEMPDDLDFDDLGVESPIIRRSYSFKTLFHRELDEYKIEIYHKFCPLCNGRSGSQIKAEDSDIYIDYNKKLKRYFLKTSEFCSFHKDQLLDVRVSGIYDTDYELEPKDIDVVWKPYVPVKSGATLVPYKGVLSKKAISSRPSSL